MIDTISYTIITLAEAVVNAISGVFAGGFGAVSQLSSGIFG